MNETELTLILIGLLAIFIGIPIICICCKPDINSLKPLGKYLLK